MSVNIVMNLAFRRDMVIYLHEIIYLHVQRVTLMAVLVNSYMVTSLFINFSANCISASQS